MLNDGNKKCDLTLKKEKRPELNLEKHFPHYTENFGDKQDQKPNYKFKKKQKKVRLANILFRKRSQKTIKKTWNFVKRVISQPTEPVLPFFLNNQVITDPQEKASVLVQFYGKVRSDDGYTSPFVKK